MLLSYSGALSIRRLDRIQAWHNNNYNKSLVAAFH